MHWLHGWVCQVGVATEPVGVRWYGCQVGVATVVLQGWVWQHPAGSVSVYYDKRTGIIGQVGVAANQVGVATSGGCCITIECHT